MFTCGCSNAPLAQRLDGAGKATRWLCCCSKRFGFSGPDGRGVGPYSERAFPRCVQGSAAETQ